jgi:hypothetical protein
MPRWGQIPAPTPWRRMGFQKPSNFSPSTHSGRNSVSFCCLEHQLRALLFLFHDHTPRHPHARIYAHTNIILILHALLTFSPPYLKSWINHSPRCKAPGSFHTFAASRDCRGERRGGPPGHHPRSGQSTRRCHPKLRVAIFSYFGRMTLPATPADVGKRACKARSREGERAV